MSETATRSKSAGELRVARRERRATRTSRRRAGRRRRRSRRARSLPHAGSPRQRQKTGRSETRSGRTIEPGWRAAEPRSRSSITSESTSRDMPCSWKSFSSDARLDPRLAARLRDEEDRPRRMALEQARERRPRLRAPLGRAPDDVRHRARAELGHPVGGLARTQPPQLALDVGDDAHGASSAGARSGRRGGSGRRPPSAPSCRSRSSGSSAGRAASRRGSRRRASTAPRPRPRA